MLKKEKLEKVSEFYVVIFLFVSVTITACRSLITNHINFSVTEHWQKGWERYVALVFHYFASMTIEFPSIVDVETVYSVNFRLKFLCFFS